MELKRRAGKRSVTRLAAGMTASFLLVLLMNYINYGIDMVLVMRVQEAGRGAEVQVAAGPLYMIRGIGLLIGMGAAVYMSWKPARSSRSVMQWISRAACVAGIVTAIIMIGYGAILVDYHDISAVWTGEYLAVILAGAVFIVGGQVLNSVIRGMGHIWHAASHIVAGVLMNLVLSWGLVIRAELGLKGAAIGTVAGSLTSMVLALIFLLTELEMTAAVCRNRLHKIYTTFRYAVCRTERKTTWSSSTEQK